jgi:hypothetical protein
MILTGAAAFSKASARAKSSATFLTGNPGLAAQHRQTFVTASSTTSDDGLLLLFDSCALIADRGEKQTGRGQACGKLDKGPGTARPNFD